MLQLLKESLEKSPVIKVGDYDYFVHPITDGVPDIRPELLKEVVAEITTHLVKDYDKLVTIEAMGLPVCAALAMKVNKPLVVIRKRSYGLAGEVEVEQITGYSKSRLFINGLDPKDRIVLIDDVLSTGGTLKSVLNALTNMGINIIDVIVVIDKSKDKRQLEEETGVQIKTLIKVDVIGGKVVIIQE